MEALFRAAIHHDVADDVAAADSGNRRRGGRREPLDTASGARRVAAARRTARARARAAYSEAADARRRPGPAEDLHARADTGSLYLSAVARAARPRHDDTRLHSSDGYVRRAHRLALSADSGRLHRRRRLPAPDTARALPHEARIRLPRPVGRPAQQGLSGYSGADSLRERRHVGLGARPRLSEAELPSRRIHRLYIRSDRRGARLHRHGLRARALRLLDSADVRGLFQDAG